jgi:sporulation protein YlmC with PRC-barrel domain
MIHTLVPSDRIEAAPVYDRDGEKIGTIERLMLDKMSGMVAYAVVKSSGFLGAGQRRYPVLWNSLKYNLTSKAYETNLTLEELRSGPSDLDGEVFDWGDRSAVYRHPQYWTV